MARPLRIQFPVAFYHVISHGNERKDIFKSRWDRAGLIEGLKEALQS